VSPFAFELHALFFSYSLSTFVSSSPILSLLSHSTSHTPYTMFQSTPLALYLFAAAFALQGLYRAFRLQLARVLMLTPAASAPVTTSLLLPNDNLGDSLPFTFSEAGVGSDGRTTYVATQSQSGAVDMSVYPCPAKCET
jgi:hypothetical protein